MPLSSYQQIRQVKDHYNTIGLHFSETRKKRMWEEIHSFVKLVKPGMRVLDVGCGNGRLLAEFKDKDITYVGIDFSKTLLDQAKKRFPGNRFLFRDITTEEGWKKLGTFDAVFCLAVLHHIPDRKRQHDVLQQIYLHTKPGGIAVFSVWNLWQTRFWKYHLAQIKKKAKYQNYSFVWIPYSVSNGVKTIKKVWRFCKAFFAGELIGLVRQAGFRVDTFYYASQGKTHQSLLSGQNFILFAKKRA